MTKRQRHAVMFNLPLRDAHLSGARALGAPDARLTTGGATFPVHRAAVCPLSGLLRGLFETCRYGDDGRATLDLDDSARGAPAVLRNAALFEVYLGLLYKCGAGAGAGASAAGAPGPRVVIANSEQARALLELAAFLDSPCVLPAVDEYLVLAVAMERLHVADFAFTRTGNSAAAVKWVQLLGKHKLRRCVDAVGGCLCGLLLCPQSARAAPYCPPPLDARAPTGPWHSHYRWSWA